MLSSNFRGVMEKLFRGLTLKTETNWCLSGHSPSPFYNPTHNDANSLSVFLTMLKKSDQVKVASLHFKSNLFNTRSIIKS